MSGSQVQDAKPRHRMLWILNLLMGGVVVISLAAATYTVGPRLDETYLPVLDVTYVHGDDQFDRYVIDFGGVKLRPCLLLQATFSWRFDQSALVTGISDAAGNPRTLQPALSAGQQFNAGPYYVVVPMAARLASNPHLAITLFYRCTWLWITQQVVMVDATLLPPPPPAAVKEQLG